MESELEKNISKDLSIIITAHHEGIIAHKTMLSIFEAVDFLENKYTTEIIVHIDNPDAETEKYFARYKKDNKVKILTNKFGDLGLSRNFAIKQAKGKYIGVIDADDLTSPNWFKVALDTIKKYNDNVVVHPEYNLTFGIDISPVLWIQGDSKDINTDKQLLAGVNSWSSMCLTTKKIFTEHKYLKAGNGYGNEDWNFNTETVADGIKHVVAKNVVQFYRRKEDSLLTSNLNNHLVQWPTRLLDLIKYKDIPLPTQLPKSAKNYKTFLIKGFRLIHGAMLRTPMKYILLPTGEVVKKMIGYKQDSDNHKIPRCVLQEWKNINHIEAQLYPLPWYTGRTLLYTNEDKFIIGKALRHAVEPITKLPDYVFIVPWLSSGGADKVLLNYIKAITINYPNWTIAVISTSQSKNEWKYKLPSNAYLIEFGNVTKELNEHDKEFVFDRLITELRCKRIHLINSQYGYKYISRHKNLFIHNYDLSVSIFNYEYIPGSGNKGIYDYADPSLVEIFPAVNHVYTDNQSIIDRNITRNAFDPQKFIVHYQPCEETMTPPKPIISDKIHILWAGRICYQKDPEIMIKIAEKLDPNIYQIDVYGKMEEGYSEKIFKGHSNIRYRGKFSSFSSINTNEYDLLLYTSNIDGVPNILLEAISAGLPVVAPDVGGIHEVITNEVTGFLISKHDDIQGFVTAIKHIQLDRALALRCAKNAQTVVKTQHSWEHFIKVVKKDIK